MFEAEALLGCCVLGSECYCVQLSQFTGAKAAFIRLPAVKHVAKATPGGVEGGDKRGDSREDGAQSATHLIVLCHSLCCLHVQPV